MLVGEVSQAGECPAVIQVYMAETNKKTAAHLSPFAVAVVMLYLIANQSVISSLPFTLF